MKKTFFKNQNEFEVLTRRNRLSLSLMKYDTGIATLIMTYNFQCNILMLMYHSYGANLKSLYKELFMSLFIQNIF